MGHLRSGDSFTRRSGDGVGPSARPPTRPVGNLVASFTIMRGTGTASPARFWKRSMHPLAIDIGGTKFSMRSSTATPGAARIGVTASEGGRDWMLDSRGITRRARQVTFDVAIRLRRASSSNVSGRLVLHVGAGRTSRSPMGSGDPRPGAVMDKRRQWALSARR